MPRIHIELLAVWTLCALNAPARGAFPSATTVDNVSKKIKETTTDLDDAFIGTLGRNNLQHDKDVTAACGFSVKKDLLAQLLELNQSVAAAIERNDPVTAPGVPLGFPNPGSLITADCIRPA